jgi:hypothetical protein
VEKQEGTYRIFQKLHVEGKSKLLNTVYQLQHMKGWHDQQPMWMTVLLQPSQAAEPKRWQNISWSSGKIWKKIQEKHESDISDPLFILLLRCFDYIYMCCLTKKLLYLPLSSQTSSSCFFAIILYISLSHSHAFVLHVIKFTWLNASHSVTIGGKNDILQKSYLYNKQEIKHLSICIHPFTIQNWHHIY